MANSLKPHAKASRQQVYVVLQLLCGLQKLSVRKNKSASNKLWQTTIASQTSCGVIHTMELIEGFFVRATHDNWWRVEALLHWTQLRRDIKRAYPSAAVH